MASGDVHRVLARLRRVNATGLFLGILALVLVALLFLGPAGGVILLLLALCMALLLVFTWAHHPPRSRVIRLVVLGVLVVLGLLRLAG